MTQEQQGKKMGEIIAKAWADEGFKQRLLADANAALKAEGVEVPAGVKVKVLENSDKVINFVLPEKPKNELSDADLDRIAGGPSGIVAHVNALIGVGKEEARAGPRPLILMRSAEGVRRPSAAA